MLSVQSQRIRSTVDEKEQKQLLMDLDVVMRSSDCPYIVQFYGALFREVRLLGCYVQIVLLVSRVHKPDDCISSVSGWLLDLYGTYGYLVRQILQVCILLIRRRDSRRNIRKNNISCKLIIIEHMSYYTWRSVIISRPYSKHLLVFLQTVKALNHLKENLKIIHRGKITPGTFPIGNIFKW